MNYEERETYGMYKVNPISASGPASAKDPVPN